jgi:hypothetical protein
VIHRLARIHLTPSRRESVARTVSPETRLSVSPSSKAASAAISKVQRLDSRPNSLGERWSIPLKDSALFSSSKEGGMHSLRARRARGEGVEAPLVEGADGVPDRLRGAAEASGYLFGGDSPRVLARRIWQRRITKESLERNPASRRSCSFSDGSRTKIGGFMPTTIAHYTRPSLRMH